MKIYKLSISESCQCSTPVVCCIGYFDGLHKGHLGLVKKTIEMAESMNCESGIITFDPDPWVTIKGITDIKHISTMKQRQMLAEKLGIKHFFILDFTKEMASLTPDQFMDFIVKKISLKGMVSGFDFHYGAKGKGNISTLQAYADQHFEFSYVNSINDETGKISSSRISKCIEEGDIRQANELLGYPYRVEGKVIHGNAKGSTQLGFPTANCDVDREFILPAKGVYIGRVFVDGKEYAAMINIGHNPTFNKRHMISVEAHILNFNQDIYGRPIEVEFYDYIREEKQFESIDALIDQLKKDVETTAAYFNL